MIRDIHRLGSPIKGVVTALDQVDLTHGIPGGFIHLETESDYPTLLSYHSMDDDLTTFDGSNLPKVGEEITAVVFNFVEGTLYLTAKPSGIAESRIAEWTRYYDYIDTIEIGESVVGTVERIQPFGIFVDIGSDYIGLIDIGHSKLVSTPRLPLKQSEWPTVGSRIQCKIEYLRIHGQQIGLGMLPENGG